MTVPADKPRISLPSEVNTDLPFATTSSITERLMRSHRLRDAIPQARHGNFQLGILVVTHHDHAAIGWDRFEHQ